MTIRELDQLLKERNIQGRSLLKKKEEKIFALENKQSKKSCEYTQKLIIVKYVFNNSSNVALFTDNKKLFNTILSHIEDGGLPNDLIDSFDKYIVDGITIFLDKDRYIEMFNIQNDEIINEDNQIFGNGNNKLTKSYLLLIYFLIHSFFSI